MRSSEARGRLASAAATAWRHWWEVNLYGDTGGLRGRKADLYEGGVREPAMIRWPGRVEPSSVSDAALSAYDILPTLAALTGAKTPTDRPFDGEDFSALLSGGSFERRGPLYWEFGDDQGFHFALRDGNWKLLASGAMDRVELYDLEADSFEVFDRASERPEIVDTLLAKLRSIRDSVANDPIQPR